MQNSSIFMASYTNILEIFLDLKQEKFPKLECL